jgi:PAS domain S-box-containing protein
LEGSLQKHDAFEGQTSAVVEMKQERHTRISRIDLSALPNLAPESLVEALLCTSRDSIKLIDLSGNVVLVNDAGLEAIEIDSFDAVRGRPWTALWPEEAAAQLNESITRAKCGQSSVLTVYRPAANGAPAWWHVSVRPLFDGAGAVAQILSQAHRLDGYPSPHEALSRRLADQKAAIVLLARQLEAESRRLSESRKQVSQSEKIKLLGQFVGGVVHDINNVLAVMMSACRLMRRSSISEETATILDHADLAIERGARLVRQLLDFSRSSSEDPEVVYLEQLLGQDAVLLGHLAGYGIDIRLDFPGDAWPVLVSPGKLQTVIFNLVANARDAMPDGGQLRLQLSNCYANERPLGLPPKDYVALTIRDTGKGMTPEVLARAGEPFFTTKERGRGTGLGLASAYDLADQCGGRISIDSALGKGAAVTLHLPRAAVKGESSGQRDALLEPHLHGGATILLLESDESVRRHAGNLLRSLNYVVIEATSPQHALAATLAAIQIDLIIVNADLAQGPGLDLLRDTRQPKVKIPKLFLPGSPAARVPPDEILLRKPISEPLLAGAVLTKLGWMPASILASETLRIADRVRDRIRNQRVRDVYEAWRQIVSLKGHFPSPHETDDFDFGLKDNSYLLEVMGPEDAPSFRFVHVGNALTERLGRPLEGEILSASDYDVLGSITRAFQRCLKGVPYFDYSRLSLGDGRLLLFERLLLPITDNKTSVTHLFGVATFDEVGHPS